MKALTRRVTALEAVTHSTVDRNPLACVDPESGELRTVGDLCDAGLLAFDVPDFARVRDGRMPNHCMATPNPDLVKFGELNRDLQAAFIAAIVLVAHRVAGGRRAELPDFEAVPAGNRQYHSVLTPKGWTEMLALSQEILMGCPASTRAIIGGLLDEPWP